MTPSQIKISNKNFLPNKFSFIKTHQQITRTLFMDTLTEGISRIIHFSLFFMYERGLDF